MGANLNPYLSFRDDAAAAMEFYRSVLGGELTRTTYGELQQGEASEASKTMHAQLTRPSGMTLMAADTPDAIELTRGSDHAVSLSGGTAEAAELRSWFTGLSEGGAVLMPLERAPWGDSFGMCVDRFGIRWMVNITGG